MTVYRLFTQGTEIWFSYSLALCLIILPSLWNLQQLTKKLPHIQKAQYLYNIHNTVHKSSCNKLILKQSAEDFTNFLTKLQYTHCLCTTVKIIQRLYSSYSQYSTTFCVIYFDKRRTSDKDGQNLQIKETAMTSVVMSQWQNNLKPHEKVTQ